MSIGKAWAPAEIDAIIGLYLIMRVLVARGERFNKRALIREQIAGYPVAMLNGVNLAGPLATRSRQSCEMKLMNVTACLESLGRDDLSMADHGYKPLNSYQAALRDRVYDLVRGYSIVDMEAIGERAAAGTA